MKVRLFSNQWIYLDKIKYKNCKMRSIQLKNLTGLALIKGPKLLLIMIRFKPLIENVHVFVIKAHFLNIYKIFIKIHV